MGANTQPPNATNTEANNNTNSGVEARIAELTKQRGDVERERNELQQKYAELELRYENVAGAVAASLGVPAPEAQKPAVDQNISAAIQEAVRAALGPVMSEFRGLRYNDNQRQLQESFVQAATPEPVRKRAQEIMDEYAKNGVFLKPDVARKFARGDLAEQEDIKAFQATRERQQFNTPYQNMGNGAGLPIVSQTQVQKPANFDSLSNREQLAWYEKNVGNQPL